jgi:hypothetical protein
VVFFYQGSNVAGGLFTMKQLDLQAIQQAQKGCAQAGDL